MNAFKTGNLAFSYDIHGVSLKYKGATVIRRSSLYVVSPGWTNLLFGHHLVKHDIRCQDINGGKLVTVSMANDVFRATYRVTMKESDQCTIDLGYELLKDVPAEMEYSLGYFSAPLLADARFEAETVEGPRSGIVPHAAKSADQRESMLVPPFSRLRVDSRLATIELAITGDEPNLVIFDARKDPQPWAREAPVFWCGLGVPQRPIKSGREYHITANLRFTPRYEVKPGAVREPASVNISDVKDAIAPANEFAPIIPEPKSIEFTKGDLAITGCVPIVLPDDPGPQDRFAAESLNEELRDIYDVELPVISAREASSGKGIFIGEPGRNSVLDRLCGDIGLKPPSHDEGYSLKVSPSFALVLGSDSKGTFYGMQTLIQLLKPTEQGVALRGAVVSDWPTMKVRAAHVFVGNEAKPFLKKMIRRIFARHKLNQLIIQADYTKWETHPEIWLEWSTSKADLKEIIEYARLHHMDVIPLVQSLGHSEWAFKNNSNLDIAEDPDRPYAFCPNNPRTYQFIFDIYNEAIELFQPRYFHIGHDEITLGGRFPHCEKCKRETISDLFIRDVEKLHDFFSQKGIRVMMWGDMMLYRTETPDAGWAESEEGARERRDRLPKNIIIADWHYCAADDFPSVRMFRELGHDVIACTWYVPQNIVDFSRSAKKDGAIGLMQTLWSGYNINESCLATQFQQYHAYILAAEYSWSVGDKDVEELGYTPAEEFNKLWRREKADHKPKDGFVIDLSDLANMKLSGAPDVWLGYGEEHAPKGFATGRVRLRGVSYDIPKNGAVLLAGLMNPPGEWPAGVRIPVGRQAENLIFLMTTGWRAERGTRVGTITIRYSDTEAMLIDLVYGENIAAWDDSSAMPSASVAWSGKTGAGGKVCLRALDWRNPCPDKAIQSIEISSAMTEASPVLFAVTGLTGGH